MLIELRCGLKYIAVNLNCPVKYPAVARNSAFCIVNWFIATLKSLFRYLQIDLATVDWLRNATKMAWTTYIKVAQWYSINVAQNAT